MARLIDADKTYEILTDYYHHNTATQHIALREALDSVPTHEPIHGMWVEMHNATKGTSRICCSYCGHQAYYFPYCPYCGTRMDDERVKVIEW